MFDEDVSFTIEQRYPTSEWHASISAARLKKAELLLVERKRRGQDVSLIDCLQLADKMGIVIQEIMEDKIYLDMEGNLNYGAEEGFRAPDAIPGFRPGRIDYRSIGIFSQVAVLAPFGDITMHVVNPPGVGFFRPAWMGSFIAVGFVPRHIFNLTSSAKRPGGTGPATVFPLGLGWQTVGFTLNF